MKEYHYETCCVNSDAASISDMVDNAQEITYGTFARKCSCVRAFSEEMGYKRMGLSLRGDWHVRYYRSTYQGRPCYYLTHSAIEYIWVKGDGQWVIKK